MATSETNETEFLICPVFSRLHLVARRREKSGDAKLSHSASSGGSRISVLLAVSLRGRLAVDRKAALSHCDSILGRAEKGKKLR
jgi:hypothetical protein